VSFLFFYLFPTPTALDLFYASSSESDVSSRPVLLPPTFFGFEYANFDYSSRSSFYFA
jgi:hypothetical protein